MDVYQAKLLEAPRYPHFLVPIRIYTTRLFIWTLEKVSEKTKVCKLLGGLWREKEGGRHKLNSTQQISTGPGFPLLPGCPERLTKRSFLSSKRHFMAVWNCWASVSLRSSSSFWGWYRRCSKWFSMAAWIWDVEKSQWGQDRSMWSAPRPASSQATYFPAEPTSWQLAGMFGLADSKIFH